MQILLFSNVDRMAKESNQGNTPLHEAASRGFSRCVKLICAPPPSKPQQKQKSRLKERVANTIEALHSNTLNIINNEGLSALHLAAQNGHNQSSRELLMAGADPDVQNKVRSKIYLCILNQKNKYLSARLTCLNIKCSM